MVRESPGFLEGCFQECSQINDIEARKEAKPTDPKASTDMLSTDATPMTAQWAHSGNFRETKVGTEVIEHLKLSLKCITGQVLIKR